MRFLYLVIAIRANYEALGSRGAAVASTKWNGTL